MAVGASTNRVRYNWRMHATHEPAPPRAYIGAALAGAAYPPLAILSWLAYEGKLLLAIPRSSDEWLTAVSLLVITCATAAVLMLIASAMIEIVVEIFCLMTGFSFNDIASATLAGGAAGAMLAGILFLYYDGGTSWIGFAFGPCLATAIGQFGGSWGAYLDRHRHDAIGRAAQSHWRFSIKQLLVVTAWCVVGLTLLRLTGLSQPFRIGQFAVWLFFQSITIWILLRHIFVERP